MIHVENLSRFIDTNGLLSPNGDCSGNGVLYTSSLLIANNWMKDPDITERETMFHMALTRCFRDTGLLWRSPTNHDQESFDDYIGIVSYSQSIADIVLWYAKKHQWVFNNVSPGTWTLKSWLGRSPAFRAHVYFAAAEFPGVFLTLAWSWSVALAAITNKNDQDAWTISAIMIEGNRRHNFVTKFATKVYKSRLKKQWKSLSNVYASYFGRSDHPLVAAWRDWV